MFLNISSIIQLLLPLLVIQAGYCTFLPIFSSKARKLMKVYYPNYMNSLLSPIGSHRKLYGNPSKGKRSKKRKRSNAKTKNTTALSGETAAIPPVPELSSHVIVGLSSISRHLENMCRVQSAKSHESQPAEMPAALEIDNRGSHQMRRR